MLRALFLIEDVSFKTDSRVRRQTSAMLKNMGSDLQIVVICPAFEGESEYDQDENGIHIYRYKKPSMGEGFAAHIAEYATSLLAHTRLTAKVWRKHGFDVIHVANPPDILWMVALPYKVLGGVKFIFDQHDIIPELFQVRYAEKFKAIEPLVLFMEKMSYQLADHVIVTTESFRQAAMKRGGRKPEDITIVRNGPRLAVDFPPTAPDPETRAIAPVMVGYIGHMNPQDHLEKFMEMARIIRKDMGRTDIGFVMCGSGDSWPGLKAMRDEWGLTDAVKMPGRIPWKDVLANLSATDICVQPDPPTAFNKLLAHNKLMEYMALGKAAVAFDMAETRVSGDDTVVYVDPDKDSRGLAEAVVALADDKKRREALGAAARRRIDEVLCWEKQAHHLMTVYKKLFPDKVKSTEVVY